MPHRPAVQHTVAPLSTRHTSICRRCAASLVCRRWRELADHPSLLGSISVAFDREDWVQHYAAFADWLLPRAPHVRSLEVCAAGFAGKTPMQPRAPSEEEEARAAAVTAAVLTACAAASQLTRLWMELGCEFQQAGLLPALRTLHELDIRTARVVPDLLREATFDASLTALTALERLRLGGFPTDLPASTLLPPTVTKLRLACLVQAAMPVQVSRRAFTGWPNEAASAAQRDQAESAAGTPHALLQCMHPCPCPPPVFARAAICRA